MREPASGRHAQSSDCCVGDERLGSRRVLSQKRQRSQFSPRFDKIVDVPGVRTVVPTIDFKLVFHRVGRWRPRDPTPVTGGHTIRSTSTAATTTKELRMRRGTAEVLQVQFVDKVVDVFMIKQRQVSAVQVVHRKKHASFSNSSCTEKTVEFTRIQFTVWGAR